MRRPQILLSHVVMGLLLLLLLATAVGPLLLPIRNPDFFWHLRTGEWIWQHRALPQEFLGAAVAQGTPAETQRFTATSYWLSQLGFHLAHAAGGMAAIIAARFVLLGALVLLLVRRRSGDGLVFLGLLGLAVAALATYAEERPQYLSFVFAALLLWLLDGFHGEPSLVALRRRAAAIPLLLLLWANCHGGYIVGLGLIGLTVLGEAFKRLLPRLEPLPPDRWRLLLGAAAAGFLVSFLNPNLDFVFRFAVLPEWQRAFIAEYQSTIHVYRFFDNSSIVAYWLLLVLTVAGLAASWRNPDPTSLVLTAVTGYLSFTQNRFVPFFVVVALPVAGRVLSGPRVVRAARVLVVAAAIGTSVLLLREVGFDFLDSRVGEVNRLLFPVEAAEIIEREGLSGNIFCHYDWGGYLLWRLAPAKVFIDGRNADRDLLEAYRTILAGAADDGGQFRKARFAAAGIRVAVIDFYDPWSGGLRGIVDDLLADPAWAPVYTSPNVVVFAVATVENRERLGRIAIPKQEFAERLLLYCAQVVAAAPRYVPVHVTRGDLLVRLGDREGALRSWREALRLAPDHQPAQERIESLEGANGR